MRPSAPCPCAPCGGRAAPSSPAPVASVGSGGLVDSGLCMEGQGAPARNAFAEQPTHIDTHTHGPVLPRCPAPAAGRPPQPLPRAAAKLPEPASLPPVCVGGKGCWPGRVKDTCIRKDTHRDALSPAAAPRIRPIRTGEGLGSIQADGDARQGSDSPMDCAVDRGDGRLANRGPGRHANARLPNAPTTAASPQQTLRPGLLAYLAYRWNAASRVECVCVGTLTPRTPLPTPPTPTDPWCDPPCRRWR